tara:strand:- start:70 stop:618 length:549 start_codon:yes stop_codon:yes gene_type:complete
MKQIILAPPCSGKTFFKEKWNFNYNGIPLLCGEWLSSHYFYKKGIGIRGAAPSVPTSHPLYKSWDELYKLGVEKFYNESPSNACLIYNCSAHIPYLRANYSEIKLKIVLVDPSFRKELFDNKWKNHPYSQFTLRDLVKDGKLDEIGNGASWWYLQEEEIQYRRLAEVFNIEVYESFEKALEE